MVKRVTALFTWNSLHTANPWDQSEWICASNPYHFRLELCFSSVISLANERICMSTHRQTPSPACCLQMLQMSAVDLLDALLHHCLQSLHFTTVQHSEHYTFNHVMSLRFLHSISSTYVFSNIALLHLIDNHSTCNRHSERLQSLLSPQILCTVGLQFNYFITVRHPMKSMNLRIV